MSFGESASIMPAGWYPDPADDARLRRWDGQKWTPDVILAPQQEPVGYAPPAPAAQPSAPAAPPPAPWPPAPAASAPQPPASAPPFVSPAPTAPPPPGSTAAPAAPTASAPPTAPVPPQPAPPQPAAAPTTPPPPPPSAAPPPSATMPPSAAPAPGPRGPVPSSQPRPDPPSGPVSLPEWANLPGLTLPPDLSSIPGFQQEPTLKAPTFEEPRKSDLRAPDWNAQPVFGDAPRPRGPSAPQGPVSAKNYAPPPAGVQYDVPPPPGAARAAAPGPVLPASSFVAPPKAQAPQAPLAIAAPPRIESTQVADTLPERMFTVWVWLIALLPLIQFGVVYLVFGQLGTQFQPGLQWGILAAPAAFSLLFAIGDRSSLVKAGVDREPSPLLAIVPPIYLLVRTVDVGRSSVVLLLAWLVLQAAAIGGVYYLLPHLLAMAIQASG